MKKIFLLNIAVLIFSLNVTAQSYGTLMDDGVIYENEGLDIHYTTVYAGEEECGQKFKVTIFINNTGTKTFRLTTSLIDISNNYNNLSRCYAYFQILFGSWPGYETWKDIPPGFSKKNTHVVFKGKIAEQQSYTSKKVPEVTWNIIPRILD